MSGVVREAFARRGWDAWSCDILPTEKPGKHMQCDVREVLNDRWDLLIAHPECKYLANSGNKHLYIGMNKRNGPNPERWDKMRAAADFFCRMLYAPAVQFVVVENPIMNCHARHLIGARQSQVIQPWMFGHQECKATCLWLRGLPTLKPTKIVGPPPRPMTPEERRSWNRVHFEAPGPDREKNRARTLPGIAEALAQQYTEFIERNG